MKKPKYQTGDILLDNDGKTYFQVLHITEYGDYYNTKNYYYTLKNLTHKFTANDRIQEYVIEQNTTKVTGYAAKILLGTTTA